MASETGVESGPRLRWRPDVLGAPYECLDLPLPDDFEGPVHATLVRRAGDGTPGPFSDWDVLWMHGWSDYFFQRHVGDWFAAHGARFYALDLRKYGRSLMPHQTPGFIADLAEYDAEIEAALNAIATDGHARVSRPDDAVAGPRATAARRRFAFIAHSTGGLVACLWAARHPGRSNALILNSPWLEFQGSAMGRQMLSPVIGLQARSDPLATLPRVDLGFYSRTVNARFEGEWSYREQWRPRYGFPLHAGWLAAILTGHDAVARGIDVGAPALVLLSSTDMLQPVWSAQMFASDTVLDVDAVARRALRIGATVTVARIPGALHDVFLSRQPARSLAFSAVERWATGYAAADA